MRTSTGKFLTTFIVWCIWVCAVGAQEQILSMNAEDTVRLVNKPGLKSPKHMLAIGDIDPVAELTGTIPLFLNKKVLQINSVYASINYSYLNPAPGLSPALLGELRGFTGYDGGMNLAIANMPFDLRATGSNGFFGIGEHPFRSIPQINFNHALYLEALKKRLVEKISPDDVLAAAMRQIDKIRIQYENSLRSEISRIQQEFESEFGRPLKLPPGVSDLRMNDISSLRSSLITTEVLSEYQQGNDRYQQVLMAGEGYDSLKNQALAGMKQMEAMEKILQKVTGWKEKFDRNPLVQELASHLPFNPGNFQSYLSKPGNLIDVIRSNASLSGIQRLFLNVTKLDLGSNPVSGGELNLSSLMNKGINAVFTSKRSSAGIIYGSGNANINPWLQAGLNSFTTNEYSSLVGMKFGSGWNNRLQQSISVNFFDFRATQQDLVNDPSLLQSPYLAAPGRRDATITWQSSLGFGTGHRISVDLSRSFGSYSNELSPDSVSRKRNAFNDLLSEGKDNYAATIDYEGEIFKTDIQLNFRKAGLGYSNPGNVFLRRGETRVGAGIGRSFLKRKLTLRYKTDFRSQYFDPLKSYRYTNFSNNVQMGYRMKRNNRLGVVIRHNSYGFRGSAYSSSMGGHSLSLQGNANFIVKLSGNKLINFLSVTMQRFDMPMLNGEKYLNNSLLLTHSSSIILNKNLVTLTITANESNNMEYFFGTSFFSSEVNLTYGIGNAWRMSSGVGYFSNSGWNKQVGVVHQVSTNFTGGFQFSLDLNLKRAVHTTKEELANQAFVSASISYRL